MEFKRASYGLYYYDLHNFEKHEHKVTDKEFNILIRQGVFNQTVVQNESLKTKRDLLRQSKISYGIPRVTHVSFYDNNKKNTE